MRTATQSFVLVSSLEPNGYYFGKSGGKGVIVYEYPGAHRVNSETDMLAFGFMTLEKDGVLYRIESSLDNNEYIEIRLVGAFFVSPFRRKCDTHFTQGSLCPFARLSLVLSVRPPATKT